MLKNFTLDNLATIINNLGLKAGISRTKQMQKFIETISVLERIESNYPKGLDNFVAGITINVVSELSGKTTQDRNGSVIYRPCQTSLGNIKLKQMDFALVCEYLKNVRINTIKPDTHVNRFYKRFYGMDKLNYKPYKQDNEFDMHPKN